MARSRVVEARGKPPEEIQRVCSSRARPQEAPRKRHEVTKGLRIGPSPYFLQRCRRCCHSGSQC
eukprot:9408271-Pyramimonas_sp.AAC.1